MVLGEDSHQAPLSNSWHIPLAKVSDGWNLTKGNGGIIIGIIDDGFDRHPEYVGKVVMEIDFDDSSPNAIPKNIGEDHGTSCAGVAAGIGILSPGVAPGCSLMLSRMGNIQSLSDTAKMFSWMAKKRC
jgi:subtilisin family serine protease